MSIFDNITFMNEGQQAEEYKARKAKEAEDKKNHDIEQDEKRFATGARNRIIGGFGGKRYPSKEDIDRSIKAREIESREIERRKKESDDASDKVLNSPVFDKKLTDDMMEKSRNFGNIINMRTSSDINRHLRRKEKKKPKNESSIFESIEMIQ